MLVFMQIRAARDDDAAFIDALCDRFGESQLPPWRTRDEIGRGTAEQLRVALAHRSDRSEVLIAEENGVRRGFVWVTLLDDFYGSGVVGKISEIAVANDGAGAGTALMQAGERWARERGATAMTLNVLVNNHRARAFYESLGYGAEYTNMVKKPLP